MPAPIAGKNLPRRFFFLLLTVFAAGSAALGYVFHLRLDSGSEFQRQAQLASEDAARITLSLRYKNLG